jgi:hypothetical protein
MEFVCGSTSPAVYEEGFIPFKRASSISFLPGCLPDSAGSLHHLDIIHRGSQPENVVEDPAW